MNLSLTKRRIIALLPHFDCPMSTILNDCVVGVAAETLFASLVFIASVGYVSGRYADKCVDADTSIGGGCSLMRETDSERVVDGECAFSE